MVFHRYINALQAEKISEAMKDIPLIDSKLDYNIHDSYLEYLQYEITEAALKGHDHFKTILSDELVKKMDKMVEFLKDKGYEVTYEKFNDFRSDPPYAVGELEISW